MFCLKKILCVILVLFLSAVAAPKKGKMVDPRDGKVYGTMDAVGLTWMTDYFPDERFPFGKAKTACPDGWRLPTLNEGLSLLIAFGVKFELNDKSLDFAGPVGREVNMFMPLGVGTFATSDGYLFMPYISGDGAKEYTGSVMSVAEIDRKTKLLVRNFGPGSDSGKKVEEKDIVPDPDSFEVYVRCVKKK